MPDGLSLVDLAVLAEEADGTLEEVEAEDLAEVELEEASSESMEDLPKRKLLFLKKSNYIGRNNFVRCSFKAPQYGMRK
jgi:hypothetical protein